MKYTFALYNYVHTHLFVFVEMTTNLTLKRLCQCWGELFVIYSWLSSAASSGCASNFFCLAYIMSRESFLHFALIDYDVKFQLPRHRMTLSQSWTKGSDLKLFSKTFLAFKSPFHQDFLATSRITFLAVNSQKVVPSSTKRSHLTKKGKNEAHHWIVISFRCIFP